MSAIPVRVTIDDKVENSGRSAEHILHAQDMESKLRLLEHNYRTFSPNLSRMISGKFGLPLDLAEEMVQEAYIKAFKKLSTYRHDGKMNAWITMIARNHTISYLRSQKRYNQYLGATANALRSEENSFQEPWAPILIGAREFLRDTDEAIDEIPESYREAVRLRKRGLAYRQIQESIGCPLGTVMSRLKRGLDYFNEIEPSIHDYV